MPTLGATKNRVAQRAQESDAEAKFLMTDNVLF